MKDLEEQSHSSNSNITVVLPKGIFGAKVKDDTNGVMIVEINEEKCKVKNDLILGDVIVGVMLPPDIVYCNLDCQTFRDILSESKKVEGRKLMIYCKTGAESESKEEDNDSKDEKQQDILAVKATPIAAKNSNNIIGQVQHPQLSTFTNRDKANGCCGMSLKRLCMCAAFWSVIGCIVLILAILYGPLAVLGIGSSCGDGNGNGSGDDFYYIDNDCLNSAFSTAATSAIVVPVLFSMSVVFLILSCVFCCCVYANAGKGHTANTMVVMTLPVDPGQGHTTTY